MFKMHLITDDGYMYTRKLKKYKFSENVFDRPCNTGCSGDIISIQRIMQFLGTSELY